MSTPVDRLIYALDGDIGPFKAKAGQVEAEAAKLGASVKAKTADAFDGATASAGRLERQLKLTSNQYQAFVKESAATGKSVDTLIASHFKVGQAAEAAGAKASGAIKLQSHQMTNLAAQVQDVAVQLGSGQNPFTIMLQQGPQMTSAVGGVSNAFKLLGGSAGIARLAVGGLAVGVGATLITAFVKGQGEAAEMERRLALIGGAAGVTRGQVEQMSRSIDGVGRGNAREILGGLAGSGRVSSAMLPQATQLTRDIALGTNQSNQEAVEYLNAILKDPAKGARSLAEDFNALSAADLRQIETLVASGRTQEAVAAIIQNAGDNFSNAADTAGTLERAMRGAAEAASNFWSFLKGIGRPEPAEEEAARRRNLQSPSPVMGALLGPQFGPANRDRLQFLENQVEIDRQSASMDERRARNQDLLRAAPSALAPWTTEETRSRARSEAVTRAQETLRAANEEGDLEAIKLAKSALVNAQNANYKPGSGVPAARAGRVDTGSRDAELARMAVADARELAAAPMRDREAMRARQQADAEYTRNSADPRRKAYAGQIRDARVEQDQIARETRQADVLTGLDEETKAQIALASAYAKGTAAVAAQQVANQAHLAWLQGAVANEDAYAEALRKRALAQAAVNSQEAILRAKEGNSALGRLVAAGGDPAALAAARRENEALAATQAERDAAKTTEEIAAAQQKLALLREELALRDRLNAQAAAQDSDARAQQSIDLKRKEIELAYADVEVRVKEIAALQAYQQTLAEGLTVGTAEFDARYEKLKAINQEAGLLDAQLAGQTRGVQMLDKVRQGLGDVAMAGTRSFSDMKDAASSFFRQLADLIMQLYVIQPLLNGLMGTSSTQPGGLIGNFMSGLFGGGGSPSGSKNLMGTGGQFGNPFNWNLPGFGGPRAGGGPVSPGKAYLVGEEGPELFSPDAGGKIIPLRAPQSASMQSGTTRQQVDFTYNITVQGNGDNELLGRMHAIAANTVSSGLQQYSEADQRAVRGRVMHAQRRALR